MQHNHHQGTNIASPTNPQPPQNKPTTHHKTNPQPQITNRTHKSQIEPTPIQPTTTTTTISTVTPEIQQPKRRNPSKPNLATQTSKPHTDLNPDTNAHRSITTTQWPKHNVERVCLREF